MQTLLILATTRGLALCRRDERGWRLERLDLEGHSFTSVIAREGVILAGELGCILRGDVKPPASNSGEDSELTISWLPASTGMAIPHVRWLVNHPQVSDFELAGTEPAGIFVSRDGGGSWRACPEVEALRRRFGWALPYSPEAGCVRGFAIHRERAYAAAEDGCVLLSDNGGETWRLAEGSRGYPDHHPQHGFIHSDVHSIEVHPSSAELVYAPTGGGFYRSWDGGQSWTLSYAGCYCRAAWVDPADPEHILLGPADGVDYNGRIEQSHDGGRNWSLASDGLKVPWRHHMVERFTQVEGELLAVLSNGELVAAPLDTGSDSYLRWNRILPDIPRVNAATMMRV